MKMMHFLSRGLLVLCAVSTVMVSSKTAEEELTAAENALAKLKWMLRQGRPRDCGDLYTAGQVHDGIYNIYPIEGHGISVYCDMESDNAGWTVIQKRGQFGNPVYHFYKDWEAYASGFGDPAKEFWLGNRAIHALTANRTMILRIRLKNHTDEILTADYTIFRVAGEDDHFRATVGGYVGEKGFDAFGSVDGAAFSTYDRRNDAHALEGCAQLYKGGWWYKACHHSNLNGLNLNGEHHSYADGIEWSIRNGFDQLYHYSYPEAEMKIRELSLTDGDVV